MTRVQDTGYRRALGRKLPSGKAPSWGLQLHIFASRAQLRLLCRPSVADVSPSLPVSRRRRCGSQRHSINTLAVLQGVLVCHG